MTATFLAAGCTLAGDRALGSGDGPTCPAGETCSSLTPKGLFFLGPATSDGFAIASGVSATAVGGTQTVTIHTDLNTDSPPFTHPFEADSENTSALTVASVSSPTFVLHGESAGTSRVRIVDPKTKELFDRVDLKAAPIASVSVYPTEYWILDVKPFALLAGSTARLTVQLNGQPENGVATRLVDESLTVGPDDGSITKKGWDLVEVKAPAQGEEVALQITAGGMPSTAKVPLVAAVDDIDGFSAGMSAGDALNVTLGATNLLCFVARAGMAGVAGASWSYEAGAGIEVQTGDESQTGSPSAEKLYPSCVGIHATTAGASSIQVTASGFAKTFKLNVVEMPKMLRGAPASGGAPLWPTGDETSSRPLPALLGGERARGLGAE